jgi:hypothetical protein
MKPAAFQGQEPSEVGEIDNAADNIVIKLRIMMRAAPPDVRRHRPELRAMLQDYVNRVMAFADSCDG